MKTAQKQRWKGLKGLFLEKRNTLRILGEIKLIDRSLEAPGAVDTKRFKATELKSGKIDTSSILQ